ncbi:GNAT family N-acetyltransferase [Halolamina sp. CBA1230]|uniref:GNAT family N-acetyltransferase n=1 Tax=Halolamina sp. CBA1230 TaxID=1853690 RepID=UPI0009A23929|nr:GNAT family N-acetyltransferase [Halolamina sp. CBA1230]QKY18888.1 GNAT family N-acetyltransferase [Halolamina sp. CBA1230]
MNLRVARETDIPGIRDVANRSLAASYDDVLDAETRQQAVESWYGTDDVSAGALAEEIVDGRTVVIVAEDDDDIVGFAQAFLSGEQPTVGRIEWLHVSPDRRGEGAASQLLDRIESELADRGADRIEASVIEENEAGRAFYEEHGYDHDHTRQVRIAGNRVAELTLIGEDDIPGDGTEPSNETYETDDGESVVVAYDQSERGSEGAFHPTYLADDRDEQYGWYCGNCNSFDVSVGSMDEFVCNDCDNRRRAMRWDAVYGG